MPQPSAEDGVPSTLSDDVGIASAPCRRSSAASGDVSMIVAARPSTVPSRLTELERLPSSKSTSPPTGPDVATASPPGQGLQLPDHGHQMWPPTSSQTTNCSHQ